MRTSQQVKTLIRQLLQRLAPDGMPKKEIRRLREIAGLGESAIRNAKQREGLTADTLLALFLAHGIDSKDILSLPIKKPSKVSPTNTKWNSLCLELTEQEKLSYMELIRWNKKRFKVR